MDDRDRLAYSSDIVLALHRHHLRAFLQFGYILLTDENEAKVHARTTEKDTHTHTRKRTHTHTHSRPDCRDIEAVSIDWDSTDRSMQTQHSFLSSKKTTFLLRHRCLSRPVRLQRNSAGCQSLYVQIFHSARRLLALEMENSVNGKGRLEDGKLLSDARKRRRRSSQISPPVTIVSGFR